MCFFIVFLCSHSQNENLSSPNSKKLFSKNGRLKKRLNSQLILDQQIILIGFMMVLRLSRVLRTTGHCFHQSSKMSCLAIRPCSENVWSVSGGGIVMVCRLSKKSRKNSDSNPIKKSKNQSEVFSILSTNATITPDPLQQIGTGISIILVDGSIWNTRIARWIRIIWNL